MHLLRCSLGQRIHRPEKPRSVFYRPVRVFIVLFPNRSPREPLLSSAPLRLYAPFSRRPSGPFPGKNPIHLTAQFDQPFGTISSALFRDGPALEANIIQRSHYFGPMIVAG